MMLGRGDAYRAKLTSAPAAVALIPDGSRIAVGMAVAQPPALLDALSQRIASGLAADLSFYYLLSTGAAGDTILRRELRGLHNPVSLFHGANERLLDVHRLADSGEPVDFVPVAFSQAPRILCDAIGVDTLVTTVSPIDDQGRFSLGVGTDYSLAVSRTAQRVIVEVNPAMPRVGGNCHIPLDRVAAIVEHDTALIEVPRPAIRPEDRAIADTIAALIKDGDCLQMGIGAVPEAVCTALAGHRNLGIHTELFTPGLAELVRHGAVDNSRKHIHPGHSVFTFAMGDRDFYRFLDGNDAIEAHPVDYVNNPATIAANPNMVSVNATLQVDLQGACNSEFRKGSQYSGAGGQLDFVRGAYASPGGRSIIACHSTAAGGTLSRIVPSLDGPVTTPRNDTHIVVTEFGWADLKGKTLRERADALIGLAHPAFRDQLKAAAGTGR